MQEEQLKIEEKVEIEEPITELPEESSTEDVVGEIEVVNVEKLITEEDAGHDVLGVPQEEPTKPKLPLTLILTITSLAIAIAALIFSIAKTDLKIGQGELYVQSGVVNEMLGNLIRNDLAARLNTSNRALNIREIDIKVVLYGENAESYSQVSNISETDSVSAEIVFFPQGNIEEFAEDCRKVLGIMAQQEVAYDKIMFKAEDALTSVKAELSGKFSMNISVEEIMAITFYFGEIELPWEINDIETIEDLEPPTELTE